VKVGIIGLGLIGGSLALDLQALGHRVWGSSRRPETIHTALESGVIEAYFPIGSEIPQDTDLVIICTPIDGIIPTLAQIVAYLPPSTMVTDVGSVKSPIVTPGRALWHNFVGSHPMAGNNHSGIKWAQQNLFQGRPCAVIGKAGETLTDRIGELWRSVGMEVYFCEAEDHDRAVAWVSHLPVMVSAALNLACVQEQNIPVRILGEKLASSGFADTSRVGGGNPELGRMMAQSNRAALLYAIDRYQEVLAEIKEQIALEAWHELEALLQNAHHLRQSYCN